MANASTRTILAVTFTSGPRDKFPSGGGWLVTTGKKERMKHELSPSVATDSDIRSLAACLLSIPPATFYQQLATRRSLMPHVSCALSFSALHAPLGHFHATWARAAATKPLKSGCGARGRERNSGWNWQATNHGCWRNSTTSASVPSGDVPEMTRPCFSISSL